MVVKASDAVNVASDVPQPNMDACESAAEHEGTDNSGVCLSTKEPPHDNEEPPSTPALEKKIADLENMVTDLRTMVADLTSRLGRRQSLLVKLAFPRKSDNKRSLELESLADQDISRKKPKCHGNCCIQCSAFSLS